MDFILPKSWENILQQQIDQPYFTKLRAFVEKEYESQTIYPPKDLIFNAMAHCSFENTKVVIVGQDPYHGEGQANGLSFSVNKGQKIPPSLRNIYKELQNDLGLVPPIHGNLSHWAKQGVLLLNATLTVRKSDPGSHQKQGWEVFTDAILHSLSEHKQKVVFLLWGAYAQNKGKIIVNKQHLVLKSAHPSPFSAHRGFLGNGHFSKTNEFLKSHGKSPIEW